MALLILRLGSVETHITLDILHIHFTKGVQSPERINLKVNKGNMHHRITALVKIVNFLSNVVRNFHLP
jgi:hypothetical protein